MADIPAGKNPKRFTSHILDFIAKKISLPPARQPDLTIPGRNGPYLNRWHLILRNSVLNIYLHQFLASDDDRALHDHPWPSLSVILSGHYIEHTIKAGGIHLATARLPGSLHFRLPWQAHRIELPAASQPCWTLFLTGPRMRSWGFHTPSGWVHWKKFTENRPIEKTITLEDKEAKALDLLLMYEIMRASSPEKADTYGSIRAKLHSPV